jgi:hypothetical protein
VIPPSASLPAEFRLAVACCQWPPSPTRDDAVRAAAGGTVNWQKFLQVVRRQRIAGLTLDGIRRAEVSMPPDVLTALAADAAEIARESLLLASEAERLQQALDNAQIPALFLKGTPLAVLAYGSVGLKHARDIDLLVSPHHVDQASRVLRDAGYVRDFPPENVAETRFQAWMTFAHEASFRHRSRRALVELHWRVTDNDAVLSHVSALSPSQLVAFAPGHALRTLGDADLFAYLCLHGAHHSWSRMKWLADVAAWLAAKPASEIARLYRHADAGGVARAAAQTLVLCEMLFGLALPADLAEAFHADRATRWLVALALNAMAGAEGILQIEERPLGNFQIGVAHFLLARGWQGWVQELRSKSVGWKDFNMIALPRTLFFLYPILRIPSWMVRRVARLAGRPR